MPLAMVHTITSTPKEERVITMAEGAAYAERRAKERRREQGHIWDD